MLESGAVSAHAVAVTVDLHQGNSTLSYRSVLARELIVEDAELCRRPGHRRRLRRSPRRGPVKLSPEVLAFLETRHRERPGASWAELTSELEAALGVRLHRRTVEKALGGRGERTVLADRRAGAGRL